jgi:hypothetical protein
LSDQQEKNRAVALSVVKAISDRDLAAVERLLHPDLDWWLNAVGHLDRTQFLASLDMLMSAKSGGFTVVTSTADQDRVAVEMRGRFEYADGRVYENDYCELMTIRDGLVFKVHAFFDTGAAQRAFPEAFE